MNNKIRDANMELFRIYCMFSIIFYHICYYIASPLYPDSLFFKTIQIPFHIGVIGFVLISGYYGVSISYKKICHLILTTFIFYVPISVSMYFCNWNGLKGLIDILFFLSRGPYWYILTYLMLLMFSPLINSFIDKGYNNLVYVVIISFVISIYFGFFKGDASVANGKNIVNFIFLYSIGRYIKRYFQIQKITKGVYLLFYIIHSLLLFLVYYNYPYIIVWNILYPYNSILLIISALFLFLFFASLSVHISWLNKFAKSTFPMYILHLTPLGLLLTKYIVIEAFSTTECTILRFIILLTLTTIIMVVCFVLDTLVNPIINALEKKLNIDKLNEIQKKMNLI